MSDSDKSADAAGTGTYVSIPESECRELLSVGVIGRVAFNSSDGIQLIPLNYFYLDGGVYFRVDAKSSLGELAKGSDDVAFEVDYHADLIKQAWSVMVKGHIGAVTEPDELSTLLDNRKLAPWAVGDRQLYLRLDPVTISGRKVKRNAR